MDGDVSKAAQLMIGVITEKNEQPLAFFRKAVPAAKEAQDLSSFRAALAEAGVDSGVLELLSDRLSDARTEWDDVKAFADHTPEELAAAEGAPAYADSLGDLEAEGEAEGEVAAGDMAGFTDFLTANEHSWQQTWPDSRDWMTYEADQRGFKELSTSFLEYVDATDLDRALVAYGAPGLPASADGVAETSAVVADEEAPTPEQAAADAMALGRRAVEELRAQVPDLQVTDEQLITILDRELRAAAGG